MNRQLTALETRRIKCLLEQSFEFCLIQPTWTGLDKGYMDATSSVREFLKDKGFHDYDRQGRGARENGVRKEAFLVSEKAEILVRASLYKPKAKPNQGGDPRIWFSRIHKYVDPDAMLAIGTNEGNLIVIDLTTVDVEHIIRVQKSGSLWSVLQRQKVGEISIAEELLRKLRCIAADGFVTSVMDARADTAVGRTLEAALGIEMNSKQVPDYKGIEIKARRWTRNANRHQLFAKVPNWEISKFNRMTDVLDAFGYFRDGRDRLNCTVSAINVNPQGLTFELDDEKGLLNEVSDDPKFGAFASWYLSDLRDTLMTKHAETFWVAAQVHIIGGRECFEFTHVTYTRNPIVSSFDLLLRTGDITMDHEMKRRDSGAAHERGPSFKLKPRSLELLFPAPTEYSL